MFTYVGNIPLSMTMADAKMGSHPGPCDDDVAALCKKLYIARQLVRLSNEDMASALKDSGAWSSDELQDREANERRIVWIAAANIVEDA